MKKPWHYIVSGLYEDDLTYHTMIHSMRDAFKVALRIIGTNPSLGPISGQYVITSSKVYIVFPLIKRQYKLREVSMI